MAHRSLLNGDQAISVMKNSDAVWHGGGHYNDDRP